MFMAELSTSAGMLSRGDDFSHRMAGWAFLSDWASKGLVLSIQSPFS